MAKKRNYRKEYDDFHGKPEQKKRRAARNAARNKALKEGRVKKGDNKEVHHEGSGRKGDLRKRRTRIVSRSTNRRNQPKRT